MKNDKERNLKLAHININLIQKKFHELAAFLSLQNIDILCISESRLRPNTQLRCFPGYHVHRKDAVKSGVELPTRLGLNRLIELS